MWDENHLRGESFSGASFSINDLTATDQTGFASQVAPWYATSLFTPGGDKYSKCGSDYIMGGYKVLGNDISLLMKKIYSFRWNYR